jgi:hypothetical protein
MVSVSATTPSGFRRSCETTASISSRPRIACCAVHAVSRDERRHVSATDRGPSSELARTLVGQDGERVFDEHRLAPLDGDQRGALWIMLAGRVPVGVLDQLVVIGRGASDRDPTELAVAT